MNDLLERYVRDVERRLPRRERGDVGRELRSLLVESIDARLEAGRDEESATVAVLEELGPPATVASRYRTKPGHWIGPELMPAFTRTVLVALAVLAALAAVGVVWQVYRAEDPLGALAAGAVDALFSFLDTGFQVLGLLVVVFLVVERLGARQPEESWDPRSLPLLDDADRVSRPRLAVGLALLVLGLTWLAFWSETVGVLGTVGGRWTWLFRPGEGFWTVAPWLVAVWTAELVLNACLLVRGRWTTALRVADVGVRLGGLAVLAALFAAPELLAVDPGLGGNGLAPQHVELLASRIVPLLEGLIRLGLVVACVVSVSILGKRGVRLARPRS